MADPQELAEAPALQQEPLPGYRDPVSSNLAGVAYMLVATVIFVIMDAIVKKMGESYPTTQLIFFRSFFAFIPLALISFRGGIGPAILARDKLGHAKRCIVGVISMGAMFYAYTHMPLADAIAIGFAAPLMITALSVPMLGEKVGPRRWTAVIFGFAGVIIIVKPGEGLIAPAALVAIAGAFFYALAAIYVRKLSRTETNSAIIFYFTLTATLLSAITLPFVWVTPTWEDLFWLISIGLIGGVAQNFMTQAFRKAEVSAIMPFEYTALLWGAALGYIIWGHIPGVNMAIGAVIVVASGLYIIFRESNLGLRRGVARRFQMRR